MAKKYTFFLPRPIWEGLKVAKSVGDGWYLLEGLVGVNVYAPEAGALAWRAAPGKGSGPELRTEPGPAIAELESVGKVLPTVTPEPFGVLPPISRGLNSGYVLERPVAEISGGDDKGLWAWEFGALRTQAAKDGAVSTGTLLGVAEGPGLMVRLRAVLYGEGAGGAMSVQDINPIEFLKRAYTAGDIQFPGEVASTSTPRGAPVTSKDTQRDQGSQGGQERGRGKAEKESEEKKEEGKQGVREKRKEVEESSDVAPSVPLPLPAKREGGGMGTVAALLIGGAVLWWILK